MLYHIRVQCLACDFSAVMDVRSHERKFAVVKNIGLVDSNCPKCIIQGKAQKLCSSEQLTQFISNQWFLPRFLLWFFDGLKKEPKKRNLQLISEEKEAKAPSFLAASHQSSEDKYYKKHSWQTLLENKAKHKELVAQKRAENNSLPVLPPQPAKIDKKDWFK